MSKQKTRATPERHGGKPWHQPGKWLVNPAYWESEALQARSGMPQSIRFIDCTVSEGGGCVALEEAAALFEMYGIATGIELDKLYDLCRYVQQAYGVDLPPWKAVAGANWNKEQGVGHLEGSADAEATIGIAPRVVGREFESLIGAKILFGRERSSAHSDDPQTLRELLNQWQLTASEDQFQTILFRARAAVATAHGRQYLTFDEFRSICEGVLAEC